MATALHPWTSQALPQLPGALLSANPGPCLLVRVKDLGLFTLCEHLHSRTWTKDLYFLQVFGPHQLIDFLSCCSQWVIGAFPKLPYRMWMSFSYPSQSSLVRSNIPVRFISLCYIPKSCVSLNWKILTRILGYFVLFKIELGFRSHIPVASRWLSSSSIQREQLRSCSWITTTRNWGVLPQLCFLSDN